jgi:hypothetical protein
LLQQTTLFKIASGIGTPLSIDRATQSRLFGHYARILVDGDLSDTLFESVIVEREGYAFPIVVEYERKPDFCSHCKMIGHSIQQCNHINSAKSQFKPRNQTKNPTHQSSQHHKDTFAGLASRHVTTEIDSLQSKK